MMPERFRNRNEAGQLLAAECELVANLAVDKSTRRKNARKAEQYQKIADRLRTRPDPR